MFKGNKHQGYDGCWVESIKNKEKAKKNKQQTKSITKRVNKKKKIVLNKRKFTCSISTSFANYWNVRARGDSPVP